MINFRFHIVSLIAIFLALALGVVIGAGVIDRGVVNTLNSRLDKVESKSDRIQLENDFLKAARDRDAATIEELQPYVLAGRLTGEQVAFVAVRGVDEDRVKASITAARQAGATVTGVLWIESKWGLSGSDDTKALATAVDEPTRRGSGVARRGMGRCGTARATTARSVRDRARSRWPSSRRRASSQYDEVSGRALAQRVPRPERAVRPRHR